MTKQKQTPLKPFFSRFLTEQELRGVSGGGDPPAETMKFPSDGDDDAAEQQRPPKDDAPRFTMKYPSDGDDGGV